MKGSDLPVRVLDIGRPRAGLRCSWVPPRSRSDGRRSFAGDPGCTPPAGLAPISPPAAARGGASRTATSPGSDRNEGATAAVADRLPTRDGSHCRQMAAAFPLGQVVTCTASARGHLPYIAIGTIAPVYNIRRRRRCFPLSVNVTPADTYSCDFMIALVLTGRLYLVSTGASLTTKR